MSSKEAEAEKKHQQEQKKAHELITLVVDELQPAALDETMDQIFRHDPSLARDLVYALPNLMRAEARLAGEIAEYLESFVPEERSAVLREIAGEFDGKLAAETTNSVSHAVMLIHRENPELAREFFPALEDFFTSADFGKMRESFIALADYWTVLAERSVELLMENPVVIANIVGVLPALVNALIKVVSHALEELDLPPEILASALFNVISAIDAEELGHIITKVSQQIEKLHAGNLILGRDEPASRAVMAQFMSRLLENLDAEAAAGAVVALGEDLEVAMGVLANLGLRDPELLVIVSRAIAQLMNIASRMTTGLISDFTKLPDETLKVLGDAFRDEFDAPELGRAIDLYVSYDLRFREANPGLSRDLLTGIFSAVDADRLDALMREVSSDFKEAVLANPGIRRALDPEEVGRRVNEALAAFNRSAAGKTGAVSDYMTRLLRTIDTRELETAAKTFSHGMIDAVYSNADLAIVIGRTAASNVWRVLKHLAGLVIKKISG